MKRTLQTRTNDWMTPALVIHLVIVAASGQRVVSHILQVAAKTLGDGVDNQRGDDLAELGLGERQLDGGSVEGVDLNLNALLVLKQLGEVHNTVHQRTGLILAIEHDDAGVVLAQLDGAVEEFSRVNRLGLDPLHLLEDAHGVIVGLAPKHSRANDHVVVNVLEVLGHGLGRSLVSLLGLDEVRSDLANSSIKVS